MGGVIARRIGAAFLAIVVAAMAMPPPASAVIIVYTLTVTPLIAIADEVTEFSVTVTNLEALTDELGCLELTVPASYELYSVSDPVQSDGRDWSAVAEDGTVVAWSESGGGRLELFQWVTFTVTARPKQAELSSWTHHAHRDHGCNDSEAIGIPVPVTILPPADPTATPTAPPNPTQSSSPKPTARPSPSSSATPSPAVVVVTPTPTPTASATATPTPEPSGTPRPTPVVRPEAILPAGESGGTGGGSSAPAASSTGPTDAVLLAYAQGDAGPMGIASLAAFTGSTMFAVPAAVLGGPGLLILLWVLLQALGTATWIPAVRRLRGRDPETT